MNYDKSAHRSMSAFFCKCFLMINKSVIVGLGAHGTDFLLAVIGNRMGFEYELVRCGKI